MTRRTKEYYSFNTGELDPRLRTRADVKHYFSALAIGRNVIGLPQGGVRFKSGSWHKSVLRRRMSSFSLSGATLTAPNGGTAGNVRDGSFSTALVTNSITGSTFVGLTVDLGSAVEISAVDIYGLQCAANSLASCFQVQTSPDNSTWSDFGTRFPLSTKTRNFRAALPPRQTVTVRYLRLAVIGGGSASLGALSVYELGVQTPGSLSAARAFEVNVDPDHIYSLIVTDTNVDVFEAGVWRSAIPVPHISGALGELSCTSSLDTVFLFHKDYAPLRILRLGSATLWHAENIAFKNVPRFDFGDVTYSNGVDAWQTVYGNGMSDGANFTLSFLGFETSPIVWNTTAATTASNIQTALRALPVTGAAGFSVGVSFNGGSGNQQFQVSFTGGLGSAAQPLLISRLTSGSGTVTVAHLQRGLAGGEDLWSATRGYPRHGVIFQQRLVMGGFRSRGNALAWSRSGELFDFDLNFPGATGAILDLLDSDDDRTILRLHIGRNLQIFTNTSAHYISNRTIDATQPRDFAQAARTGVVAGSRSVDLQGATIFVEHGGEVIREFLYNDVEQSYDSGNMSILQSHLVTTASDLAVKRSNSSTDADLIFVTRADGTLPVMVAERAEQVTGVTWISSANGPYRSVCVDGNGLVHAVRERSISGTTELVLEVFDDDVVLDAAITGTVAGKSVSGLGALEGLTVWAYVDGSPYGPYTVAGGSIDLSADLDETPAAAVVGLWEAPLVETLPLREADSEGAPIRKRRIHKVWASIFQTGNIAVGANGKTPHELDIFTQSEIVLPLMNRLKTGDVKRQGILGWSLEGSVTVTQTVPAPFMLRGLRAEYDG